MKRKEQLQRESEVYAWTANQFDIQLAFKKGAEWEHKRLVHNACEWIDDVDISKYLSCIFSGTVNISFISDDFIIDFKKAMEE